MYQKNIKKKTNLYTVPRQFYVECWKLVFLKTHNYKNNVSLKYTIDFLEK